VNNVIGIVGFVIALLLSVMLHEAGHFVTARRFGMKASRFFLGFGPTLWSFRRGETEYGIKAIPAGGFVRIEGMTALEEVSPEDEPRAFYRQPAPQRAVVLAAGSVMHFIIAILLVYVVLMAIGTQRAVPSTVGTVSTCVVVDAAAAKAGCGAGSPAGPAQLAGVRTGDRVVSIDGVAVKDWDQFTQQVRNHGPGTIALVVERDGRRLTLHPTLVQGLRNRATGGRGTDRVGVIGLAQRVETVHHGPVAAIPKTFSILGSGVAGTYDALVHRLGNVGNLFSKNRDANGPVGVVGAARVGGEVLSTDGASTAQRFGSFLLLVAGVNLAIGLFNLLPLLPLDGGHLAVLGFEQARYGARRVRGYRGPPQRVNMLKLLPATYAVGAFLLVLSVLILSADIINPIRLNP
jgi:membrane-associated protease RseP (regulator of RpoE activity)